MGTQEWNQPFLRLQGEMHLISRCWQSHECGATRLETRVKARKVTHSERECPVSQRSRRWAMRDWRGEQSNPDTPSCPPGSPVGQGQRYLCLPPSEPDTQAFQKSVMQSVLSPVCPTPSSLSLSLPSPWRPQAYSLRAKASTCDIA